MPSTTARLSAITPARPLALAAAHAALGRPVLLVVAAPRRARDLAQEVAAWAADPSSVLLFPESDALPYDYLPSDPEKLAARLAVLRALADERRAAPPLVVASARAAMDLLCAPEVLRERSLLLERGGTHAPAQLAEQLLALGYEPSSLVDEPGAFSRRGGIVDVFPPGGTPVRLEFWGNEVESIRAFDVATQRSSDQLPSAWVGPAHEVLPEPVAQDLALDRIRPALRPPFERDVRHLADRQAFPSLEFYRGFLGVATLLDYLPGDGILALEEPAEVAAAARDLELQVEKLHAELLERGELPMGLPRPYRPWAEIERGAAARSRLELCLDPDAPSLPFEHAPRFGSALETWAAHLRSDTSLRLRATVSQQAPRLAEVLHDAGIEARLVDDLPEASRDVVLVRGLLNEGWTSAALSAVLYTDGEVFGWSKQRRTPRPRREGEQGVAARDAFLADLEPGTLVVHVDHGIGRFLGLVEAPIGFTPDQAAPANAPPATSEFLLVEYAEGDRLYVPISQADRVGRYQGAGDQEPTLTRLGSGEWTRAKARVRRSVRDIAGELLDLYSARKAVAGHAYPTDTTWQAELEASFPFEETPDQARAIEDVKHDMQSPLPMDRLLIGDVGFGKTEVALRAAFKAVQDGCQVAVLVPTTVLAQQHFTTFTQRLGAFPIRVEMLSRFRSEKEQRAVLRGLADGSVDICIGTHRLVQRDVSFKSLGLVIIDEEQRFGVAHKERLKQLRTEVDVLTLTATPIPRTLHMGLVGVRDMSVLETPPEARLPVRTYVQPYDDGQVAEAILRELDRGGQVYFVHNRVRGIEQVAHRLRNLVPEARIMVGHGQMPEEELETTMLAFAEGGCDVLVCTTIIESGLDIPNANTLIVDSAEHFGLAQLYQLRGRVGRGPVRAYAYFLHGPEATLSEVARERLRTIFEATELGAGMRIAMRDLEIRGAGALLGAQQSGQISAVGFDLYTQLLSEQVALLRARTAAPGEEARLAATTLPTALDLPLGAYLPAEYVGDDSARLRLYQRFATVATDAELAELVSETEDRFGKLPPAAQNLVYTCSLRLRAREAGVERILTTGGDMVLMLREPPPLDLSRLEAAAGTGLRRGANQVRFTRDQGTGWMAPLYALVDALAARQARGGRAA